MKYFVILSCSETKLYDITGMPALAELILYPQQLCSVSSGEEKTLGGDNAGVLFFNSFVSSLCPQTCPAMCQPAFLCHGCQGTRAESTSLRLGAQNVV